MGSNLERACTSPALKQLNIRDVICHTFRVVWAELAPNGDTLENGRGMFHGRPATGLACCSLYLDGNLGVRLLIRQLPNILQLFETWWHFVSPLLLVEANDPKGPLTVDILTRHCACRKSPAAWPEESSARAIALTVLSGHAGTSGPRLPRRKKRDLVRLGISLCGQLGNSCPFALQPVGLSQSTECGVASQPTQSTTST